jgi:hypothetical protein
MSAETIDQEQPDLGKAEMKPKASVSELFGGLQGQVIYHEDINTPTLEEWAEA